MRTATQHDGPNHPGLWFLKQVNYFAAATWPDAPLGLQLAAATWLSAEEAGLAVGESSVILPTPPLHPY